MIWLSDTALTGMAAIQASGSASAVTFNMGNQGKALRITDGGRADVQTGGTGNDTIRGGAGADTLSGGAPGTDILS